MSSMNHRFLILVMFLFSFYVSAQNKGGVNERPIEVILGIDKVVKLDFAPDTRIQVGNESILTQTLIPQKREISFKGLKPGKTSVIIRNSVGDIKARFLVTVTASDQSKLVKELKDFLGDIEGLEIGIKGDTVFLGGQIVVPSDIGRIVTVHGQTKFQNVLFLVELSPQAQRLIARKMQEEIQKNGLKNVTARVINNSYWLEGVVTSEGQKTQAEQVATAFFPAQLPSLAERTDSLKTVQKPPIQNFIQVNAQQQTPPLPKLVKITAQFVELTKDYVKTFGFRWEPLLADGQGSIGFGRTNSGNVTTQASNTFSGTISSLLPKLASAKQAGYARVIQSGVIIVRNTVQGTLNKTESLPFSDQTDSRVSRSERASAEFRLTVLPTILQEEKIDINVGLNVTSTVGSPSQTTSNEISTTVIVKSKESAVIGGIVIGRTNTEFDRNPPGGAQEIPDGSSPLFSFVRSKSLSTSKSQFAMFITPEIIESASSGTDDIKRKFRQRRR